MDLSVTDSGFTHSGGIPKNASEWENQPIGPPM